LRHEFHTEPDKSKRDDRSIRDDHSTHHNRFADDRGL
jgi:hypothetical protein